MKTFGAKEPTRPMEPSGPRYIVTVYTRDGSAIEEIECGGWFISASDTLLNLTTEPGTTGRTLAVISLNVVAAVTIGEITEK